MFNLQRRRLIKLSALIPSSFIMTYSNQLKIIVENNLHDDLNWIYHFWKSNTHIEPETYFFKHNLITHRPYQLKSQVIEDFKNQKIFDLDGYILSETEVAILALLGKEVSLNSL